MITRRLFLDKEFCYREKAPQCTFDKDKILYKDLRALKMKFLMTTIVIWWIDIYSSQLFY